MFGVIKSIPRGASRLQLTAKKGHHYYKGNLSFDKMGFLPLFY